MVPIKCNLIYLIFSSLGVGHDSEGKGCPDGLNIMATGTAHGSTLFQWSKCSSEEIKTILE